MTMNGDIQPDVRICWPISPESKPTEKRILPFHKQRVVSFYVPLGYNPVQLSLKPQ